MTKKERLEQLEREVLQLHAEVAALKSKPDPWKPIGSALNNDNYYTCQVCYGRYMVGGYHSCGGSLPYNGGWFNVTGAPSLHNWYG